MESVKLFLKKAGCDGLFLTYSQDSFISPPSDRLFKLTGFSGSFGVALVLPEKEILWTDSRYTLQAGEQSRFQVKDIAGEPVYEWISRQPLNGLKIACFQDLSSVDGFERLQTAFQKAGAVCLPISAETLDTFIRTQIEPEPASFDYSVDFAGKTTAEKIEEVLFSLKDEFEKTNAEGVLITEPASVSWLLNKRAQRPYTPVVLESVLVDRRGKFFILPSIGADADKSRTWALFSGKKVLADFSQTTEALKNRLEAAGVTLVREKNPCDALKAVKNETELEHISHVSLQESAVLCSFFLWLKENFKGQTELSVVERLHEMRRKITSYRGDSFPAISAFGAHGAIVHYQPDEKTDIPLEEGGLYLLDTGGQYLGGTTDVTRTIALGKVPGEAKKYFTAVLKGHISLAKSVFPKGTRGNQLDAFARQHLWHIGADYGHGTGHGIGAFLNVHEAPPSISPYSGGELKKGMVLSNEPGVYLAGKFGVRLENMMEVSSCSANEDFLCFKMLSFVPFDMDLVNTGELSESEKAWLREYCEQIMEKVSPFLEKEDERKLSAYLSEVRELLA